MTIYSPSHDELTEEQVRAMLAEYPAITPQWRADNGLAARRYDRLTATLAERVAQSTAPAPEPEFAPKMVRKPISASGVSRSLHSMDFQLSNPNLKYKREGAFVENGTKILGNVYEVRVSVQIEAQGPRERCAEAMAIALRGRGYVVKVHHNNLAAFSSLTVSRPAVTA